MSDDEHYRISPTAKMVAYWRQLSDIPYAKEVAELSHAEATMRELFPELSLDSSEMKWAAPFIEIRYKCMVKAIEKEGITQVLELASGVSLRGLALTQNSDMVYVETDLVGMHEEKTAVVQEILKSRGETLPKNLFFHAVNVLDFADLEKATSHFDPAKPIAIIHEGLFQYLSMDEKQLAASHFKKLLDKFGGIWLTPDLDYKEDQQNHKSFTDEQTQKFTAVIAKVTNRDFSNRMFDTEAQVKSFFEKLGFAVKHEPQYDGSYKLSALGGVEQSAMNMDNYYKILKLWKLKVK